MEPITPQREKINEVDEVISVSYRSSYVELRLIFSHKIQFLGGPLLTNLSKINQIGATNYN
jgi:hypothetical protein